eukprot:SAG31_NODE_141_length_22675_cov_48.948879_12_plen_36_part_00
MLKRIHWTIGHGGGEYGSEDSADDSVNYLGRASVS